MYIFAALSLIRSKSQHDIDLKSIQKAPYNKLIMSLPHISGHGEPV